MFDTFGAPTPCPPPVPAERKETTGKSNKTDDPRTPVPVNYPAR